MLETLLQNEYTTTVLIGGIDNDMLIKLCWKNIGYNVDISKVKVCPMPCKQWIFMRPYITEKQDKAKYFLNTL